MWWPDGTTQMMQKLLRKKSRLWMFYDALLMSLKACVSLEPYTSLICLAMNPFHFYVQLKQSALKPGQQSRSPPL